MKNFIIIVLLILMFLLFIVDALFPIIISFWTGNFWLLFLYAVWWIPLAIGIIVIKGAIEFLLEMF